MEPAVSAAELLNVWERTRSASPVDCALLLADSAGSGATRDELAQFNIGRRDEQLLNLRERLFGTHMTGRANCPACNQAIEMNLSIRQLRIRSGQEIASHFTASFNEYAITFRLPNTNDVAALIAGEALALQKRQLAKSCVLRITRGAETIAFDQLPDEAVDALSERMSALDPQGDVELALTCPQCSYHWEAPLDIASFVWTEVQAHAAKLLRDVHLLASHYGWREAEILSLSPARRQAYLDLITQ